MKRTWIKIKRGLLQPKHMAAIGPSLWLFELLIDQADWDTGTVRGWTDAQAAVELGMKPGTVRDWRQRLEKCGYISCVQVGRSQNIQIHNWTHPKEYSESVVSRRKNLPADVGYGYDADEGTVFTAPSDDKGSVSGSVSGETGTVPLPLDHTHTSQGEEDLKFFVCGQCGTTVLWEHRNDEIGQICRLHQRPQSQQQLAAFGLTLRPKREKP